MKKCWWALAFAALLTGCSGPKDFETMSDLYYVPELSEPCQTVVELPEDAALAVLGEEDSGQLYLCEGYSVAVQTMESGDLDATLQTISGYSKDQLKTVQLQIGDLQRIQCVWASAGEGGDQVGRAVVMDDGDYHYCLTILGDAELAGQLADTWQGILDSFSLRTEP